MNTFTLDTLHIDDVVVYLKNERTGSSTIRKCKFIGQVIKFTETKVKIRRLSPPDVFVCPDQCQDLGIDTVCQDDVVHIIISKYEMDRIGELNHNKQNCLMRIIKYNNNHDIVIEFQDKYMAWVHTSYNHFKKGSVKNPYYPSIYGVGMVGNKCPTFVNGKQIKEYVAWVNMLGRCYSEKHKDKRSTYKDVTCCKEWLLYENFYEWLHSQKNFDQWLNGEKWSVDKDILVKDNKIYSPDTCCLVPNAINSIFTKRNASRGKYPIGVSYQARDNVFSANVDINGKTKYIGNFNSPEQAFLAYKEYKENYIKQIAQEEYSICNITKQCYEAMMNYKVEIND